MSVINTTPYIIFYWATLLYHKTLHIRHYSSAMTCLLFKKVSLINVTRTYAYILHTVCLFILLVITYYSMVSTVAHKMIGIFIKF